MARSGDLLPPSPAFEKATACQDQTGKATTGDGERERRRPILLWFLTTLLNPAAALGDEALGKRGEGCRASPLLRRGRTVQTLAKAYEDRAAECSRAAQQADDPVFRRLLLMLASQWKLAAREEAKSKDAPTPLASTQPQTLDESRSRDDEPIRHSE